MRVPGHQRKSYAWRWTAALAGLAVLTFALVMALAVRPAEEVHAAGFIVNVLTDAPDLGDTGGIAGAYDASDTTDGICDTDAVTAGSQCSLRAAIFEANANGDTADNITFGSVSGTINIGSTLPVGASPKLGAGDLALADSTTIDSNLNVTVHGGGFICFEVTSASNVIRDLSITGCSIGVQITGDAADGNALRGNTIYSNTNDGVQITGGADNNTVGGTSTADRNIIRDNGGDGVDVAGAGTDGNVITGNCIGTTATCSIAAPNGGNGVRVSGSSTTVGGTASGAGNTIAFNAVAGVDIAGGTSNIVTRNVMFLNAGAGILSGAAPAMTGCADAGGGMVSCTGNSTPGYIIDVYHANVDASGPEGDKFLCTTVAGGGGAWGCTFANPGGGSATATQRDPANGNTSRFSDPVVGIPAGPVITATPTPTNTPLTTPTVTPTPGASHFYGYAYLNGLLAPAGTSVTATINGYTCGTTTVAADGSYAMDVPSSTYATGCGTNGATVNFTVAGYAANSGTWYANTSTNLNLFASSTATVTPTPTTPTATATPTTVAMESVPLVAGCNPVASTYPDDTPITTIANAVSPAGVLISIWKFDTATSMWRGYSPTFPQASDLSDVGRLDAIFICVSSAATLMRPLI